ncbi:capsular biosynthesis protein [Roseomonas sp. HJA6]|uniref:Capsular biosynthesis protein n=1 Tax=Roseomonas alba TaxID=2846776 RepID=A0ABS7A8T2_9PROT|nr:capsular biosynthesis protein [Neoroseomonas alba]MBW6398724.1 capsular biosynthesis protein [Neoroseomonas alba]
MRRLIMDLDGTIARSDPTLAYPELEPIHDVVEQMRRYKADGFTIVIHTARNMRTFEGQVGRINVVTLPIILDWLRKHEIPFDEVHVGKPWCGTDGFYVDDRALRPDEFVRMSPTEIQALFGEAGGQ